MPSGASAFGAAGREVAASGRLRSRATARAAAALIGSQAAAVLGGFITLGILSRSLDVASFGLWTVLASLAGLAQACDLGLAHGMRNRLAALTAEDPTRHEAERRLFVGVVTCLGVLALLVAAGLAMAAPTIPWGPLLGAEGAVSAGVVQQAAVVVSVLFLFSMPLNACSVAFFAYQEGALRSAVETFRALALVLTVTLVATGLSVVPLAAIYYAVYNGVGLLALLLFMHRRRWRWTWMRPREVVAQVRPILRGSLDFWVLGLSALAVISSDPPLVAHVLGLSQAGEFAVVQRLFALVLAVHIAALSPLWSAYTHAAESGEWWWIERLFRRSLRWTAVVVLAGCSAVLLGGRPFLAAWVGRHAVSGWLLASLSLWAALYAFGNCYSVLLNGLGIVRHQAVFAAAAAILNVPVSLWLAGLWGASGVALATVGLTLPVFIVNVLRVRRVLAHAATSAP